MRVRLVIIYILLFLLSFVSDGVSANYYLVDRDNVDLNFRLLDEEAGMTSGLIGSLTPDRYGRCWGVASSGVVVVDRYGSKEILSSSNITLLSLFGDSHIIVRDSDEYKIIDLKTHSIKEFSLLNNLEISSPIIYNNSTSIFLSNGHIYTINHSSLDLEVEKRSEGSIGQFTHLYKTRDNIFVVTRKGDLFRLNGVTSDGDPEWLMELCGLHIDLNLTILGVTTEGVWIKGNNREIILYDFSGEIKCRLSDDNRLGSVVERQDGLHLFSTSEDGVAYLNRGSKLCFYQDWPGSFHGRNIRDVAVDFSGNIWCSTPAGVIVAYTPSVKYRYYALDSEELLDRNYINALELDGSGGVLIGNTRAGFWYLSNDSLSLVSNADIFQDGVVESILKSDKPNQYYIGTRLHGLFLVEIKDGVVNWSRPIPFCSNCNSNDGCRCGVNRIVKGRDGNLLIAAYDGTYILDMKTNLSVKPNEGYSMNVIESRSGDIWSDSKKKIYRNEVEVGAFESGDISQIFEDYHGDIWVASREKLSRWNNNSNSFDLISNKINPSSIAETDSTFLWLGTRTGIKQYEFKTGLIYSVVESYSDDEEEMNPHVVELDGDKSILFGSNGGVLTMDITDSRYPLTDGCCDAIIEVERVDSLDAIGILLRYQAVEGSTAIGWSLDSLDWHYGVGDRLLLGKSLVSEEGIYVKYSIGPGKWSKTGYYSLPLKGVSLFSIIALAIVLLGGGYLLYAVRKKRAVIQKVISSNNEESELVDRVREVIIGRIDDSQISQDDISEAIGVSRSTLYRKVKSVKGVSVNEYIKDVRVEMATTALVESSESISNIAYQMGFNTPSYFSQCFKQKYGITPREFRLKSRG